MGKNGIRSFLGKIFHLEADTDKKVTPQYITKNIEFAGSTMWMLIFAMLIASVGLNINSAAVIIGAMLISPIMGPIMGAGFSIGTYDFALLKRSLRNLALMTVVSLLASTIYFLISPLKEAQSEILARTYPTLYDALIAFFGGAAGIIASSRKERTLSTISGVAIATALMPPLCTAGFGIANGDWKYFAGALYLYIINSVCIGIATFVMVRYLDFKKKKFLDKTEEKKIHRYVYAIAIIVLIPSAFIAYDVISVSSFRKKTDVFIEKTFLFPETALLKTKIFRERGKHVIELTTAGKPVSEEMEKYLSDAMKKYEIEDAELRIIDSFRLQRGEDEKISKRETELLDRIKFLENEIISEKSVSSKLNFVEKELRLFYPQMKSLEFSEVSSAENGKSKSKLIVKVVLLSKLNPKEADKIKEYLSSRLYPEKVDIEIITLK
ncbi:MAG TPA: DUF389 domain-containing protein [Spirochaetota bacterium]|nr:DUF389 domain-containing protein [Spirochaetota bacterium]HQE58493.1 DUF389 domain-containing protein [Spirochaetota bacterium]